MAEAIVWIIVEKEFELNLEILHCEKLVEPLNVHLRHKTLGSENVEINKWMWSYF